MVVLTMTPLSHRTHRLRTFIAQCLLTTTFIMVGCGGSNDAIQAPSDELASGTRIASISGHVLQMKDGSTVTLPTALPVLLLQTPGLPLMDAHAYENGALLRHVCAEPPHRLAGKLDQLITAQGWQTTQSNDVQGTSTRLHRQPGWVLEITSRSDAGITHVTTQIEATEGEAVP